MRQASAIQPLVSPQPAISVQQVLPQLITPSPVPHIPPMCYLVKQVNEVNEEMITKIVTNWPPTPAFDGTVTLFTDLTLPPLHCTTLINWKATQNLEAVVMINAYPFPAKFSYQLQVGGIVFSNYPNMEYNVVNSKLKKPYTTQTSVIEDDESIFLQQNAMNMEDTSVNAIPLYDFGNLNSYSFVNSKSLEGFTLAHYCAVEGWVELLSELFNQNITSIMDKDTYGMTPLDYASKFQQSAIEELIKKRMQLGWQLNEWDQNYTLNLNPNFHDLYDEYKDWRKKENIRKLLISRAQEFLLRFQILVAPDISSLTKSCVKLYCSNTQYCGKTFYSYLNHALSHDNKEQLKTLMPIIRLINNYLSFDEFKEHNKICTVYKRCTMSNELIEQMIPETSFRFPTYTTTTTSATNALQQTGNVILEILVPEHNNAPHYRSVKRESDFAQEEEVVFVPYSKFSVVQITKSNTVTRVVLQALDNCFEARPEMPMTCPDMLLKIPVLPRSRKLFQTSAK